MTQCYMCDQEGITVEHIPPRALFPESKDLPTGLDLRKNLITVPACDELNLRKSGDDEYLLFVLVGNIDVNFVGLQQWQTKIRRSLAKRPSKYGIFKNPRPINYLGIDTGGYEIDFDRISRQLDWISRGLYYYHVGKRWSHEIQLAIPLAISAMSKETQRYSQTTRAVTTYVSRFLENEPQLGDNREVFYYQYKLNPDSPGFLLKMVFYGGIVVAAMSNPGQEQIKAAA